ncbi:hypothetical protein SISNIDRAFT_451660 [Sistotremastrum niveocremeum HHB9708]|uniref:Uncharacterized protein n=1 Tax=Sistotremastrum niveocremeum HHB9708 TaxID=1314777 RepID=A0A164XI61_9AGAM|nr:hypothetical protein SISNIDRAFT_451660 [Sistotremastrum niveocremeum HHB9708]
MFGAVRFITYTVFLCLLSMTALASPYGYDKGRVMLGAGIPHAEVTNTFLLPDTLPTPASADAPEDSSTPEPVDLSATSGAFHIVSHAPATVGFVATGALALAYLF